jgi:tripeptide aminopeptidase
MEKVVERFAKYVKYDTNSKDAVEDFPSTPGQMVLAADLAEELESIGMKNVSVDKYGYVFASLPSNVEYSVPSIGFIAHMDTSPEMPGKGVNPKIVENYDGGDIVLNKELNIVLSPKEFPELKNYIGQAIITTDGTTLLGADDKAGIAEIMTAMEYFINHPEIKHGPIMAGFTPDEEVGRGVDFFDVKKFGADFAYTLDGGSLGELDYENFNAARADITVKGRNTHPGTAKGVLKNSISIAAEFISMFPKSEVPENAEGYEGFYHLHGISGGVDNTTMKYILRDFGIDGLDIKKKTVQNIADELNKKYGSDTVIVSIKDQYYNMLEKINENKQIVDIAYKAIKECGIEPKVLPVRGGTDGSRLSFMGLPTPNIFDGGHNFHGRFEYIPIPSMLKSVEVIVKIAELYATK